MIISLSVGVTMDTSARLKAKTGLPLLNQIISWATLGEYCEFAMHVRCSGLQFNVVHVSDIPRYPATGQRRKGTALLAPIGGYLSVVCACVYCPEFIVSLPIIHYV